MARHKGGSVVVVLVTCPTAQIGRRIARQAIKSRVAACVNLLGGVESLFWWEGRVDRAREVLLLIKTSRAHVNDVTRLVTALHPYEVPEVIALPVVAGHASYLQWVQTNLVFRR